MKQKENKYIVYVNEDWIKLKVFAQYPSPSAREYSECRLEILNKIMNDVDRFISNQLPISAFLTITFMGPDGKYHHAIEFNRIPTDDSRRPGKLLKRVKVLRKGNSNRKS